MTKVSRVLTNPSNNDVINWKYFPRYWPFVRGIHRSPVNSPHKGQWRGTLMFSMICTWVNGWVNTGEAGDLRRYRAHYDVTVIPMKILSQMDRGWSGLLQLEFIIFARDSTRWYRYLAVEILNAFSCKKTFVSRSKFWWIVFHESNWQQLTIGPNNAFVPNRRQAITEMIVRFTGVYMRHRSSMRFKLRGVKEMLPSADINTRSDTDMWVLVPCGVESD